MRGLSAKVKGETFPGEVNVEGGESPRQQCVVVSERALDAAMADHCGSGIDGAD